MNKYEAAKQIFLLAQQFMPAIIPQLQTVVGPELTEDEKTRLLTHLHDYETWAGEMREKAGSEDSE